MHTNYYNGKVMSTYYLLEKSRFIWILLAVYHVTGEGQRNQLSHMGIVFMKIVNESLILAYLLLKKFVQKQQKRS